MRFDRFFRIDADHMHCVTSVPCRQFDHRPVLSADRKISRVKHQSLSVAMRKLIGNNDLDFDLVQFGIARVSNGDFQFEFVSDCHSIQMLNVAGQGRMVFQRFGRNGGHLLDDIGLNHIRGYGNLGMRNDIDPVELMRSSRGNPSLPFCTSASPP